MLPVTQFRTTLWRFLSWMTYLVTFHVNVISCLVIPHVNHMSYPEKQKELRNSLLQLTQCSFYFQMHRNVHPNRRLNCGNNVKNVIGRHCTGVSTSFVVYVGLPRNLSIHNSFIMWFTYIWSRNWIPFRSSYPVLSGVCVARSLVFGVVFADHCLAF
jgi:hypothetical protein